MDGSMLRKLWGWGVVLPATLAVCAGVIADAATASLQFWWLIWPAYPVIVIGIWRGLTGAARERRRRRESSDDIVIDGAFTGVVLASGGILQLALRALFTLAFSFMAMIGIQAVVDLATWGRPFWYVYVPVALGIAWFVWSVYRTPPDAVDQETSLSDP